MVVHSDGSLVNLGDRSLVIPAGQPTALVTVLNTMLGIMGIECYTFIVSTVTAIAVIWLIWFS